MFQQQEGIGRTLLRGVLAGIGGVDPNEILLRREQAETEKAESEARIAASEATTKDKEAALAEAAAEQNTALTTLLSFQGEFVSGAARSFFERIGDAEDPFADIPLLAQASLESDYEA